MGILDEFVPTYYEILKMGIQRTETGLIVRYHIGLRNSAENRIGTLNQSATLLSQEEQAIVAIFQRDKAAFENATGLTEWEE